MLSIPKFELKIIDERKNSNSSGNSTVQINPIPTGLIDIQKTFVESVSRAIQIYVSDVIKQNDSVKQQEIVEFFNPTSDITQISYEGYRYSRNKKPLLLRSGLFSSRYRCEGCHDSILLLYNPISKNSEIVHNNPRNHSSPQCIKIKDDPKKVDELMYELKFYAMQKYQEKTSTIPKFYVISDIYQKYNQIQSENKYILPLLSSSTVEKWYRELYPADKSNIWQSPVPEDLRCINNQIYVRSLYVEYDYHFIYTTEQKNKCNAVQLLLLDGTFKFVPKNYAQVLNGMGYDAESRRYVPLFHILLNNKKKKTYICALRHIFSTISFGNLRTILSDYEIGLIDAIFQVFKPDAKINIHGCYFHYAKAIRLNFKEKCGDDPEKAKFLRAFILLPYLNYKDYRKFMEYMQTKREINKFLDYFIATWGVHGKFNRTFWSINEREEQTLVTTNGVERYHESLNLGGKSPNIRNFIKGLFDLDSAIFTNAKSVAITNDNISSGTEKLTYDEVRKKISKSFPDLFKKEDYEEADEEADEKSDDGASKQTNEETDEYLISPIDQDFDIPTPEPDECEEFVPQIESEGHLSSPEHEEDANYVSQGDPDCDLLIIEKSEDNEDNDDLEQYLGSDSENHRNIIRLRSESFIKRVQRPINRRKQSESAVKSIQQKKKRGRPKKIENKIKNQGVTILSRARSRELDDASRIRPRSYYQNLANKNIK